MDPFIGEIKMVGFTFAPLDWAMCDGQILQIAQNSALFALLGTTYGGNGSTTFALPDLRGRVPLQANASIPLGSAGGAVNHTLAAAEMPSHKHAALACEAVPDTREPANASWPSVTEGYAVSANASMKNTVLGATGGGSAHENRQPFIVVNFIIALQGLWPVRP
jgi:microcystin-dependent protein